MKFNIKHLIFEEDVITCDETNLPKWMQHKEFQWWVKDYVFKLNIKESIESDFHRVTRVA